MGGLNIVKENTVCMLNGKELLCLLRCMVFVLMIPVHVLNDGMYVRAYLVTSAWVWFWHTMLYLFLGYLTNAPRVFFSKLLEYASSLVEQGVPPRTVIQTSLPNLFGPIFGIRNHSVSCKLLEYGYLAACSQHKWVIQYTYIRTYMCIAT